MTRQEQIDQMVDLLDEIQRGLEIHGPWSNYDTGQCCKAVCDEYQEYMRAYIANDFDGPHGQENELLQLAAVAIKKRHRLQQMRGAI